MTVWDKMAIFETTAKNLVLERWGVTPDLKYVKKMKKFDLVRILSHNHEIPLFCEKFTGLEIWEKNSRFTKLILKIGFCVQPNHYHYILVYLVPGTWYRYQPGQYCCNNEFFWRI